MKERATLFAQEFRYQFTQPGEVIPFGRSLTYRPAQVSFSSALVSADVEALPWGEIKGLISRHLHQWMDKDVFTIDGSLSVGCDYQDTVSAEGYNGPGLPYWAFKTFILLAAPKDHPYWQTETQPISFPEKYLPSPGSWNYYQVNDAGAHGLMFPVGQLINYQVHAYDKYSEPVYPSHFGFSTIKSGYWYYEGAHDSCLALAEDNHYFRTKGLDDQYEILDNRIIHQWHPWSNVAIKTAIVPLEGQRLRIHETETQCVLVAYEGGFSIPFFDEKVTCASNQMAEVKNVKGVSKVENINGFSEAAIIRTEPNISLPYPLTELPYLKAGLLKGKHLLISLVIGVLPNEQIEPVKVRLKENQFSAEEKAVILGNQGEKYTMTENGQIEWLSKQVSFALNRVRGNLETFKESVPPAVSLNQIYHPEKSIDWTASLWPGMLFSTKELTDSTEFGEVIATQMASFQHRLGEQIELETHDIGLLHILTAIADYQVNGHEVSKEMTLQTADLLMKRYSPEAKIIQAWGNSDDPEQRGRMIIDCLMNLLLLYFAAKMTGKQEYYEAAYNHAKQT